MSLAKESNPQIIEIIKLTPPKLTKSFTSQQQTVQVNDSSDDEVKDYLTIREPNYDEISHV
jgi:hypothetical protein